MREILSKVFKITTRNHNQKGSLKKVVMYAYIKGTLTYTSSVYAIIEASGVGYQVHIPANALNRMPHIGSETMLYTSFVVREQSHSLFGFPSQAERELFEILLGVSGIGPKTAISLIGHMNIQEFIQAVKEEDIKKICRVPGIGKKTAERLFLEIRDKLASLYGCDPSEFTVKGFKGKEAMIKDAISGLINLGYNHANASKAIKQVLEQEDNVDLPELITKALKHI